MAQGIRESYGVEGQSVFAPPMDWQPEDDPQFSASMLDAFFGPVVAQAWLNSVGHPDVLFGDRLAEAVADVGDDAVLALQVAGITSPDVSFVNVEFTRCPLSDMGG